ncbi:RGS1-HXK1-interacting protein 1 isoform X2 [Jatropha curcas]|uniref:RGS1-HXK1-interacting protein 1 isoform X2 n=1 Tax=Jatropha curcas TaxID=180498 RepID=UPI0018933EE9|nr:RGS1-HXK1-interacting protein 1 isoform X2 [Jatropha curcas]
MATVSGPSSPEEKPIVKQPNDFPSTIKSKTLEEVTPWIDSAVQQALIYQKNMEETLEGATSVFRSRFSEIRSTSSAHFHQTIDSLQDFKSEFDAYEDMLFGKVKEGVKIAVSHPIITGGVAVGLGLALLKRPRRFLYYNTLRLFVSEEKRASLAETELIRGRTKLRQAGKQIQGVIRSAYKIEKQAAGLKDVLRDLPSREASRFRSKVSSLSSEAKQEKNALTKEITKISNYGISV